MREQLPILPIVILFAAAFLTPLVGMVVERWRLPRLRDWFAVVSLGISGAACLGLAQIIWTRGEVEYRLGSWPAPWGITLNIDGFNLMVALLVAGVSLLVGIYTVADMSQNSGLTRFYTLYLLLTVGIMGLTFTGDIFNLYVFLEIMSVAAYGLVAFEEERPEAIAGAYKYLVLGSVGTGAVLLGIAVLYGLVGTLNMRDLALKVQALGIQGQPPLALSLAMAALITGLGLKAAVVPLHSWKPDAYAGASMPVGAVLAAASTTASLYALVRLLVVIYIPWLNIVRPILLALAVLTMLVGGFLILQQNDLRRVLAYSSISQVGYILLGLGLWTPIGSSGALLHLMNFAIMETLLFLAAGVIIRQAGTSELRYLGGWGRRLPTNTMLFGLAALASAGVPPLNGFASKWLIYRAGLEAGHPFLTVIAVVVSALTLIAYGKVFSGLFLGPVKSEGKIFKPSFLTMLPTWVLAILCILLGLWPAQALTYLRPALAVLADAVPAVQVWGYWDPVVTGVLLLGIAVLASLVVAVSRSLTRSQPCPGKSALYLNGVSTVGDGWGCSYADRELYMAGQHLYWAVRRIFGPVLGALDLSFLKGGLGWVILTVGVLIFLLVQTIGGI
ncbi:NAD(P)H-quinone oxidoreductase subunit 2, chloroplastic [Neomoorella glycerini]|uniref:NAD(P)H-quinone oxidoreductase subunit 2, chloroplastic n=1 Tax=Neomoorella glycerini TaxID=55779 RepID=A0A6I5ZN29_9FIRM|nr:proton-conducting transporter membrane subunit [Moorella glycerini]QGP91021.1 NAD(P)H-quinone oxidoreductase subunit 2, chloroplastic [Moorella glycerini]